MERKLFLLDADAREILASIDLDRPLRPSEPTVGADDRMHSLLQSLLDEQAEDGHVWSVESTRSRFSRHARVAGLNEQAFRLVEAPAGTDGLTPDELLSKADSDLDHNGEFVNEGWLVGCNLTDDMVDAFHRLIDRAGIRSSTVREIRELVDELQTTLTAIAVCGGYEDSIDVVAAEAFSSARCRRYAYVDGDVVLVEALPEAA
jgi:hypothetical protein